MSHSVNYPLAIACALTALGFVAHVTGGLKQSLSTSPSRLFEGGWATVSAAHRRNWLQLVGAFQLVTVDLLALTAVLYLLAFTDALAPARAIAFAVSGIYFAWGVIWLVQLGLLRCTAREFLSLGHWAYWLVCSALIFRGALSL